MSKLFRSLGGGDRRWCCPFCCMMFIVLLGTSQAEPQWSKMTWAGEAAWEASSSGWTAVVSAERGRLVSIAPVETGDNLLFTSPKDSISWGGHRCWLGPQAGWKSIWPPPG